jgi:hypothetical protein
MKKLKPFSLMSGMRQWCPLSPLLFLASAVRQELIKEYKYVKK